jgi:hypothetical protein
MDWFWTWGGKCFGYRTGDNLFTYDGRQAGRFYGDEVYGSDGHYLGEIKNNNLITHSAKKGLDKIDFWACPGRVIWPIRQLCRLHDVCWL